MLTNGHKVESTRKREFAVMGSREELWKELTDCESIAKEGIAELRSVVQRQHKGNLNQKYGDNEVSLLHELCRKSMIQNDIKFPQPATIATVLIEDGGLDPNTTDALGRTPLHYCFLESISSRVSNAASINMVGTLIKHGARLIADNLGNTPLHLAANGGCSRTLPLLLSLCHKGGPNENLPNEQNDAGLAALHCALAPSGRFIPLPASDQLEFVTIMATFGCDLEVRTESGYTPFLVAIMSAHVNAVKILLHAGSDPFAKSADGQNAMQIAASELCETLQSDISTQKQKIVDFIICIEIMYSIGGDEMLFEAGEGDEGFQDSAFEILTNKCKVSSLRDLKQLREKLQKEIG